MKSNLQIVADALRAHGFGDIAGYIENATMDRDNAEALQNAQALDTVSGNYGSSE